MTAQDETVNWRRIADERLGKLAAIARIGAEPPDAVLAIIAGKEPDPDAGTADTSTMYHHSVTEFRRELVKSSEFYMDLRKPHDEEVARIRKADGGLPDNISRELWDARAGLLMAGSYSYTLAAILRVAEEELGPQSARRLASIADDILTNGDFDDLNADVKPGTPLPPPSPAEQAGAGQLALGQPEPAAVSE